jgi:hypothetical protein
MPYSSYWQEFLDLNPILALSYGDNRGEQLFDDSLQDGWRTRMVAFIDKYLQGERRVRQQRRCPRPIKPVSPCCANN